MTDETQASACADKLVFNSKAEAQNQARVLRWQRDIKLKVYQCRDCDLWHLSGDRL